MINIVKIMLFLYGINYIRSYHAELIHIDPQMQTNGSLSKPQDLIISKIHYPAVENYVSTWVTLSHKLPVVGDDCELEEGRYIKNTNSKNCKPFVELIENKNDHERERSIYYLAHRYIATVYYN